MPLLRYISTQFFELALWQITETPEILQDGIALHPSDQERLQQMGSPMRQREFWALRQCLRQIFGENPPVYYRNSGKPYIDSQHEISFSHTKGYAAVIVSEKRPVGIDIEGFRHQILKIKARFMSETECQAIPQNDQLPYLTAHWCAKEVIVKIEDDRRLDFRKDMRIAPFLPAAYQTTTGYLRTGTSLPKYQLYFKNMGEVLLSYGYAL